VSRYLRCEVCDKDPRWTLTRRGDVVTTWSCALHIDQIADRLQRDHEVTELVVTFTAKSIEWASVFRSLEAIAEEGKP
jgi:hypothetical protein